MVKFNFIDEYLKKLLNCLGNPNNKVIQNYVN